MKTVKIWPEGALSQLQDCFETTEWSIFEHPELHGYTDAELSNIKVCTDSITADKCIRVYGNCKP